MTAELLDKVLGEVNLRGCEVRKRDSWYSRDERELVLDGKVVTVEAPSSDVESMSKGLLVSCGDLHYGVGEDLPVYMKLLRVAHDVQTAFNKGIADQVQEAKDKQAAEQEKAQREKQEREVTLEERSERLLTEFMGDKGRIRLRGYKRWRPVTVDVVDTHDGSYKPVFKYVYEKHGYMEHRLDIVRAFQVKEGSRYAAVWNDGQDDLNPWDRKDSAAPKYKPRGEQA